MQANAEVAVAPELVPVASTPMAAVPPSPNVVATHAAELEWFWCWGQSVFERSTFGALLERQSLFGQETQPCDACGGDGFKVSSDGTKLDDTCRACQGCGMSKPRKLRHQGKGLMLGTARCGPCHGRPGLTGCPRCGGAGYVDLRPVYVANQSRETAHYTPDDVALTRYAVVSRWLLALDARSPMAVDVMERYYGLEGLRWGRVEGFGRVFSLGHLTRSGKRLLIGRDNPQELPVTQLFENVCLDPATKKKESQAKLLRGTQLEGIALHNAACQLWDDAVKAVVARKRAV